MTSWPELASGRCPRVSGRSSWVAGRAESATDLRWVASPLSPGPVGDLGASGKVLGPAADKETDVGVPRAFIQLRSAERLLPRDHDLGGPTEALGHPACVPCSWLSLVAGSSLRRPSSETSSALRPGSPISSPGPQLPWPPCPTWGPYSLGPLLSLMAGTCPPSLVQPAHTDRGQCFKFMQGENTEIKTQA